MADSKYCPNLSSNVNEVIRAVLNLFFLRKDFARPQKHKSIKTQSSKDTRRSKRTKIKNVPSKGKKVTYLLVCVFVLFVRGKKRK